jgi:hypothetical protein
VHDVPPDDPFSKRTRRIGRQRNSDLVYQGALNVSGARIRAATELLNDQDIGPQGERCPNRDDLRVGHDDVLFETTGRLYGRSDCRLLSRKRAHQSRGSQPQQPYHHYEADSSE